jgi:two-component system chemotaxis response regulator CheB
MPNHDVIVIGGSAGALEPLKRIVELLPDTLAASVFIVIHTKAEGDGVLPEILRRRTRIGVAFARDHDPIEPRRIYIAPPNCHLLVARSEVRVVRGPRENGFRPAVDPLFRTAATTFGARVVGVVLSGALGDGAYGLSVIKHHGGVAVVQDPSDATFNSMPYRALAAVDADYVAAADDIAAIIARLCSEPANDARRATGQGEKTMARSKDSEPQLPSDDSDVAAMEKRYGAASSLTCPDCGGALWEVEEGRVLRYQCHVGHQYAPDVLDTEQRDAVDGALWSAVRALEEHSELKRRMARRAESTGLSTVAEGFKESARDAHRQAQQIRTVLFSTKDSSSGAVETTKRAVASRRPERRRRKLGRTKRAHKG